MKIVEAIGIVENAFFDFVDSVSKKLKEKPPRVLQSDNAEKLGDKTANDVINSTSGTLNDHVANKNNPHHLTPASLGGVAKEEIDALSGANVSACPLSYFGAATGSLRSIAASFVTLSGWVYSFSKPVHGVLCGVRFYYPRLDIDVQKYVSEYANKTFYVYLVMANNKVDFVFSTTALNETMRCMYIGSCNTDEDGITAMTLEETHRIGFYRVSTRARGSAIPCSTGASSMNANTGYKGTQLWK